MASVKLGQLLSVAGNILGLGGGLTQRPKTFATQLLKSNPLEIDEAKSPTAHLVKNPLEFTNIQFPRDLGLQDGAGHYIIFYSIQLKSIQLDSILCYSYVIPFYSILFYSILSSSIKSDMP